MLRFIFHILVIIDVWIFIIILISLKCNAYLVGNNFNYFAFKAFFDFLAFKTSNEIISFKNLSSCLAFFAPLAISFFTTFYLIDGRKPLKALFTLFCTFVFYSVFTQSKSYFFAVLISLLAYYCYKNLNFVTASLLLLSSTLIFAVLCTYLYDVYNNLIMGISSFVSNKGNISSAMFGFVNTFLSPLDFSSFENMFYYKSFWFQHRLSIIIQL